MNTLLRTLLVWFVLLAVPFQGFAAAAMTCAHGMGHTQPGGHAKQAKPPCHGDAAAAASPDGTHEDAASPYQKSCGNCAACSVGAAMAPASAVQAPSCCPGGCCPSAAPAPLAEADPDLPERPPRHSLA